MTAGNPYDHVCPRCGARPRSKCRTSRGVEAREPHMPRLAAAVIPPTVEDIVARDLEARQFAAQYAALVRLTFTYSCGCLDGPSELVPLGEANTWPGRAFICDRHDEYVVCVRVAVELNRTREQLRTILWAADVDPDVAAVLADEQARPPGGRS